MAQLSQKFEVNAVTISKWKSEFLANMSAAFSNAKESSTSEQEVSRSWGCHRDVRDVCTPHLIGTFDLQASQQVWFYVGTCLIF